MREKLYARDDFPKGASQGRGCVSLVSNVEGLWEPCAAGFEPKDRRGRKGRALMLRVSSDPAYSHARTRRNA